MRVDKTQESLSITDIIASLKNFERLVFSKAEGSENKSGFLGLLIACNVYKNLVEGPFPMLYGLPKIRDCSIHVAAAMDLVRYFNKIGKKSKLKAFKKHLRLVGIGGFGLAATYTHQQAKKSFLQRKFNESGIELPSAEMLKDASRKSIELMLGLASLNTFDDALLEDPEHSDEKNPNPDIIIRHGDKKYGIACKSLNSKNKTSFRERIQEALGQIERAINAGNVDKRRGMVLLDISALLNHDDLYMPSRDLVWNELDAPRVLVDSVDAALADIFKESQSMSVADLLGDLFEGKKAAPCVLIYAHSLMIAGDNDSISPRYFKVMKVLYAGDHSSVKGFVKQLNRALHCQ